MDTTPLGKGHALTVVGLGVAAIGLAALPALPRLSVGVVLLVGAFLVALGIVELIRSRKPDDAHAAPTGDITVGGSVKGDAVAIGHQASASVTQAPKPTVVGVTIQREPEQREGGFWSVHVVRVDAPSYAPGVMQVRAKANSPLVQFNVEGLDRHSPMVTHGETENGMQYIEIPNPFGRYRITIATKAANENPAIVVFLDHTLALGIAEEK